MRLRIAAAFAALCVAGTSSAIGTAFSFQGTLEDGGLPANGLYDLQFQLKTAGGSNVGSPLIFEDQLVSNGVFTIELDFGSTAFAGADRRIGMAVRAGASAGAFTPLLPDLPVSTAPYAQVATDAFSALSADDVINGAIDEVDMANSSVST